MESPAGRRRLSPTWSTALWMTTVLPPIVVFTLIARLGVNVPFQDDWDTASILVKWRHGTLTLTDFWQQHSEHRILTVRLFIWLVGAITNLNLVWQMFFGAAAVVAALLMYRTLARLHLASESPLLASAATAAASLLLFTLVLEERWFFGTAATELLVFPLALLMVWALLRWRGRGPGLAIAVLAAALGTFVEASGFALWATGALLIWMTAEPASRRARLIAGWLVGGLLVAVLYTWNLHWERTALELSTVPRLFVFVLTNLGTPFVYAMPPEISASIGAVSIVALAGAGITLQNESSDHRHGLAPMLVLAIHGLLVAAIIGIGRSGATPGAAMVSHHAIGAVFFWMGALPVIAAALVSAADSRRPSHTLVVGATVLSASALLAGYVVSGVRGYREADERSRNLTVALASLYNDDPLPKDVSRFLYPPDDGRVQRQIGELRFLQLGPFAPGLRPPESDRRRLALPSGVDFEGFHDGGNCEQTTGWAWNPSHPDDVVTVDVWFGNEKLGTTVARWYRRDLETAGKGNGNHGFVFVLPTPIEAGTGRRLTVTIAGSKTPIGNSPQIVMCD